MVAKSRLIKGTHRQDGLSVLLARSWCTPGHILSVIVSVMFVCLFFLISLNGTVAGVGVRLAVHLF